MNIFNTKRPAKGTGSIEMESVIKVSNVSKRFKLYSNVITGPVKELLFFWKRHQYYKEFKAVKNVSFEIKKGEVVGIIGPNGAGKSTLLKMIAGLLPVDEGNIELNGKVTALLALGVGVHPEFTGRENILYGGMLLGMSKQEVLRKTPGIIEFSELGEFIDQPFRTYSSGMKARLLFSISMSIDPDILIVDEALATGDAYFVQKCSERIQKLCISGATILFVSHNLSQIQQLCQRAYFMAEGHLLEEGTAAEVISAYNRWVFKKEAKVSFVVKNDGLLSTGGSGEIEITDLKLKNSRGEDLRGFYTGESMTIDLYYRSHIGKKVMADLFLGFITCGNQAYVGEMNTVNYLKGMGDSIKKAQIEITGEGRIQISIQSLLLLNNHYSLWIILYDKSRYFCEYKNVFPFFVARRNNAIMRGDAIFWQPCEFTESVQLK